MLNTNSIFIIKGRVKGDIARFHNVEAERQS